MSKIIVVTGATRGLGRALVEKFVPLGHTIIGCGRSSDHIQTLRSSFAKPHDFTALDVCDADAVIEWGRRVIAEIGVPDLLINNAAVMNTPATLWEVPASDFDAVIDVNVKGVANVIRAIVPAMVARRSGVIVNLSSGWGRSTSPEVAPYCASKFAIEGMSLALASELPKGMASVPLNPGVIDTDMLRGAWGSSASAYPSPAKWAERAVPFLLQLAAKDNGKSLSVPS